MFGFEGTIDTLISVMERYTLEELQERIDNAKREIAKLERQKKYVCQALAAYRKNEAEQKKRQEEESKKWKEVQRKQLKVAAEAFGGAPLVTAPYPMQPPARRKKA